MVVSLPAASINSPATGSVERLPRSMTGARSSTIAKATRTGPDAGYDAIGDLPQGVALLKYLDLLAQKNALPRMVIYNSTPADTYLFATLAGSFQDGQNGGK